MFDKSFNFKSKADKNACVELGLGFDSIKWPLDVCNFSQLQLMATDTNNSLITQKHNDAVKLSPAIHLNADDHYFI